MFEGFQRVQGVKGLVAGHFRRALGRGNHPNISTNGNSNAVATSSAAAGRSLLMEYPLEPDSPNHLCYSTEDDELLLKHAEEITSWTEAERDAKWTEFANTHRAQRDHTADEWIWAWVRRGQPAYLNGLGNPASLTAGELHARQEKEKVRVALLADGFEVNPNAMRVGNFFYAPDHYAITPGEEDDQEDGQFEMEASYPGHIVMPNGIHNLKIRKWLSMLDVGDAYICFRTTTRTGSGLEGLQKGSMKWKSLVRIISEIHATNRDYYQGGIGCWIPLVLAGGEVPGDVNCLLDMHFFTIKKSEFVKPARTRLEEPSMKVLSTIYHYRTQLGSVFSPRELPLSLPTSALTPEGAHYFDRYQNRGRQRSRSPQRRDDTRQNDIRYRSRSPLRTPDADEASLPPPPPPAAQAGRDGERAFMSYRAAFCGGEGGNEALTAESDLARIINRSRNKASRVAAQPAIAPPQRGAKAGNAPAKASRVQAAQNGSEPPSSGGLRGSSKGKGKGKARESDIDGHGSVNTPGDMTKIAEQMQNKANIGAGSQGDAGPSNNKENYHAPR